MKKKKETIEERELKDTGMVEVNFLTPFSEDIIKK
jgi:hypothetical protein